MRRLVPVSVFCAVLAQAQVITTIAGTDPVLPGTGVPASGAPLRQPIGVAVDSGGNIYVADEGNNIVARVSPDGVLTIIAGNGIAGFSGDGGPATSASLNGPEGLALDAAGNLYIADSHNNRIRKVSGGMITTVASNGFATYSGDGVSATSAPLSFPSGVAVDAAGNLYIADTANNRIRRVSGGTITTVAGNGLPEFEGEGGPATSAALDFPSGIALDAAGNLYIADTNNNRAVCAELIALGVGTIATKTIFKDRHMAPWKSANVWGHFDSVLFPP
jgi:sugar lactone lactonase YvrE